MAKFFEVWWLLFRSAEVADVASLLWCLLKWKTGTYVSLWQINHLLSTYYLVSFELPISTLKGTINYKMLFEEVLKLAPETIKSLQTVCWGIKSSELISLISDRFWNRCSRLLLAITTLKLHPLFILSFIWMQYLLASVHVFIDAVISQSFFKKAKCQQMCT